MRVLPDGKTPTSESDTADVRMGRVHAVQVFERI